MSVNPEDDGVVNAACEDPCCGALLRHHLDARRKKSKIPFVVLYGSETGNSKSIAEKVHEQALARNLPAKLAALDEYEACGLLGDERLFCAIVVSTTGNGDAPKGAEKMFRFVKKRTHPDNLIKQVGYSVLALGDTNYDKFCYVGKTIDTRLEAIGARRLAPVICADDVIGLDTCVEPWISKLWDLYASLSPHEHLHHDDAQDDENLDKDGISAKLMMNALTLSSPAVEARKTPKGTSVRESTGKGWQTPGAFQDFGDRLRDIEDVVARTKRLGKVREPFPLDRYAPSKTMYRPVHIICGEYLAQSPDRTVIKLTLELDMVFDVGDSLAVQCPNPLPLVALVADRLRLPHPVSEQVRDILMHGVNLATPPDRGFLRSMSVHCSDPLDRARMDLLSSSGGREEYDQVVEAQKLNVHEVLQLFPSCHPDLDSFLGALGPEPPPPRYYSIASSPLVSSQTADVCFSVVQTNIVPGRTVRGVCTNELELLFLSSTQEKKTRPSIMAFVKPNATFKLPADDTRPVIMVGPGTGVAPFRGFIQHRPLMHKSRLDQIKQSAPVCGAWRGGLDFEDELEQAEDALISRTPEQQHPLPEGETTLYFGCRRAEVDFLFKNELHEMVEQGKLSKLRVAFSRPEDMTKKQYVQDLLLEDAQSIADQIVHQNAYFYVCGDGTKMAKDVQLAVQKILCGAGSSDLATMEDAKAYIVEMQKRGRYVQDIW